MFISHICISIEWVKIQRGASYLNESKYIFEGGIGYMWFLLVIKVLLCTPFNTFFCHCQNTMRIKISVHIYSVFDLLTACESEMLSEKDILFYNCIVIIWDSSSQYVAHINKSIYLNYSICVLSYRVFYKLPQIYTANHATFRIQMCANRYRCASEAPSNIWYKNHGIYIDFLFLLL